MGWCLLCVSVSVVCVPISLFMSVSCDVNDVMMLDVMLGYMCDANDVKCDVRVSV